MKIRTPGAAALLSILLLFSAGTWIVQAESGKPLLPGGDGRDGPAPWENSSGRTTRFEPAAIVAAYAAAFPMRIAQVQVRNGDWAMLIDGEWYYWADGRMLPEELRSEYRNYDPYPFYSYPHQLPRLTTPEPDELARLRERVSSRESSPPRRHPAFFNALWRIHDRETSWQRMKTTYFLGFKLEIHRELLEDLAAVEEEIQLARVGDPELARYIDGLAKIDAYNWRAIAGTSSLSFHSYGAAIDFLPRSYQGRQVYWRWAASYYPDWFLLPYEERFMPPEAFIKAFEKHGFIWGGKWFYFDTIHFEYRPEILLLNGVR